MKRKNDFDNIEKISINRTVKRSIKINRLRNIFIITLTALITFMSVSAFSIAFSYGKNYSIMTDRRTGTPASVKLKNFNSETLSRISALDYVKHIGIENELGSVINKNAPSGMENITVSVKYLDDIEYKKHKKPSITKIFGFFPNDENEIAISRSAISVLNLGKIKIGDYITLDIKDCAGKSIRKTFRISMIYTDYISYTHSTDILVSERYFFDSVREYRASADISFRESTKRAELSDRLIDDIDLSDGEQFEKLINTNTDIKTASYYAFILGCIAALLILLFGGVILYNMFDIYVKQDILFFSKLKMCGASSGQINLLVRKTAVRLAVYAIPIGIIAAVCFSVAFVPAAMKFFNEVYIIDTIGLAYHLSFNPLPVVVSAVLTFICVISAAVIPANKAARFSVSKGMDINNKNKLRFYNENIYKTALQNIFSDRLNFIYVIIPAALGMVSFLIINTSVDINRIADIIFNSELTFINEIDFLNSNMVVVITKTLLLGASVLLYITGVMNFVNEILSNYNNKYYIYKNMKTQEDRQKLRKVSVLEGVYYAAFINLGSLLLISVYLILFCEFGISSSFYLTVSLFMMLFVFVICTVLPLVMYEMFVKRAGKE